MDLDMVRIANELLTRFGAIGCIKDIRECNQEYFVRVFENMMGEKLPGRWKKLCSWNHPFVVPIKLVFNMPF